MELINPTITVQNTDQALWLVRMQQQLSEHEHLDVQLKLQRKPQLGLAALQAQLLKQLADLVQHMRDGLPPAEG